MILSPLKYFISRSKQRGYVAASLYFDGLSTQSVYCFLCFCKSSRCLWESKSSLESPNCLVWEPVYVNGCYPSERIEKIKFSKKLDLPHIGFIYLLKKNLVPAFSGAWTKAKVHGSRSLGFIMGAFMNTPFWLPDPFHDTLTWALASRCSSSLVRLRGIYDLRFYI